MQFQRGLHNRDIAANSLHRVFPFRLIMNNCRHKKEIMKTTVELSNDDIADVMRFTKARTKREAIVAAIQDFNRRKRMAELSKHAGTCKDLSSVDELLHRRRTS